MEAQVSLWSHMQPTVVGKLAARVPDPSVTIGIPCFGNHGAVIATLTCLAAHTDPSTYRLLLLNDDPSDSAMDGILRSFRDIAPHCEVLTTTANMGVVCANNRFIDACRTEFLCLMNSDVLVTPGWLERFHEVARGIDNWAAIGARLLYPDMTIQHAGVALKYFSPEHQPQNDEESLPYHPYRCAPGDHVACNQRRRVAAVTTALAFFRTSVFATVGGFDERFSPGMYDDPDLCFRLCKVGMPIWYEPTITAFHLEGGSFARVEKRQIIHRNATRFLEKWRPWLDEELRPRFADDVWGVLP